MTYLTKSSKVWASKYTLIPKVLCMQNDSFQTSLIQTSCLYHSTLAGCSSMSQRLNKYSFDISDHTSFFLILLRKEKQLNFYCETFLLLNLKETNRCLPCKWVLIPQVKPGHCPSVFVCPSASLRHAYWLISSSININSSPPRKHRYQWWITLICINRQDLINTVKHTLMWL